MNGRVVRTAGDVDREALNHFLRRVYSERKADFLEHNGDWWHRGRRNRWVLEDRGTVVAYCAVIPSAMCVGGERVDAAWWVDLVVDPNHRGRGLQRAFDTRVREAAPLIVGFPNALAARIHRKHGWGVREDLEVRLLPLRPVDIVRRRALRGATALGMRAASVAAAPVAAWVRHRLNGFKPRYGTVVERPRTEDLAGIFRRNLESSSITTFRDEKYLNWRYLEAPWYDDLCFVVGGRRGVAEVAAVIRFVQNGKFTVAKILDLFGALNNRDVVRDVVWSAASQALSRGACQMTAMSSSRAVSAYLREAGFILRGRGRFCWTSNDDDLTTRFGATPLHLVLGDSDNDEP